MAKDELPPSHLLCPPPPFTSRPQLRGLGLKSAVSSPSGVWGEAPADERFCAYWNQKVQLWWQQFLLIFLRKNAIFCTKTSLISYGGSNSSQCGGLWVFSWGSRHHCPMEVGAYVVLLIIINTKRPWARCMVYMWYICILYISFWTPPWQNAKQQNYCKTECPCRCKHIKWFKVPHDKQKFTLEMSRSRQSIALVLANKLTKRKICRLESPYLRSHQTLTAI